MNKAAVTGIAILASALVLSGCSDENKARCATDIPTSASVDSIGKRYEIMLAKGIDFRIPDYPDFLTEVKGVSGSEAWGRWSDDKEVSFKFKNRLPEAFTLELIGGVNGANLGKEFRIRIGGVEKAIVFTSDPFENPKAYRIDFKLKNPADTIEIVVPEPTSPSASDPRKLGLGLISLKIIN